MQRKIRLTPVRLLALVYIGIIFLGAVLLVLPFSTKDGPVHLLFGRTVHRYFGDVRDGPHCLRYFRTLDDVRARSSFCC